MNRAKDISLFDPVTNKNVNAWLNGAYPEDIKDEIEHLINTNPKEIVDAFYTNLSFGTGGLRGIVGLGTNRINAYTVRAATQGLANYLNEHTEEHSVFIGYDSRHRSKEFAQEAAKVLAANKIRVYLCKDLRPTPLISFGCRFKNCAAGIMITASHNPPEYNGYKVYWNDGAQVLPPHDKKIIKHVNAITNLEQVKILPSLSDPMIELVGEEIDEAYFKAILPLQLCPDENKKHGSALKIVYTSLHGTGITLIPQVLKLWGFTNIFYVDKQIIPDGNFPTIASPNPEEKAALLLGIETLKQHDADLLIATDPDADRVGIAVNHHGQIYTLDGNQIACICLKHILSLLTAKKKLPERAAFIKTIGTTELFKSIVRAYGKICFNVPTGFKYIAEKIREWEGNPKGNQFVFGGEESFGYLFGTEVRDKDAISTSALICEAALYCKIQKKTLVDFLHELWKKHGIHVEKLLSIKFEDSKEGKGLMDRSMALLRKNPPKALNGIEVISIEDYETSKKIDFRSNHTRPLTLPPSNVLLFWLKDHSKVMIRPSGTESKIKIYCGVVHREFQTIEEGLKYAETYADQLLQALQAYLQNQH